MHSYKQPYSGSLGIFHIKFAQLKSQQIILSSEYSHLVGKDSSSQVKALAIRVESTVDSKNSPHQSKFIPFFPKVYSANEDASAVDVHNKLDGNVAVVDESYAIANGLKQGQHELLIMYSIGNVPTNELISVVAVDAVDWKCIMACSGSIEQSLLKHYCMAGPGLRLVLWVGRSLRAVVEVQVDRVVWLNDACLLSLSPPTNIKSSVRKESAEQIHKQTECKGQNSSTIYTDAEQEKTDSNRTETLSQRGPSQQCINGSED